MQEHFDLSPLGGTSKRGNDTGIVKVYTEDMNAWKSDHGATPKFFYPGLKRVVSKTPPSPDGDSAMPDASNIETAEMDMSAKESVAV